MFAGILEQKYCQSLQRLKEIGIKYGGCTNKVDRRCCVFWNLEAISNCKRLIGTTKPTFYGPVLKYFRSEMSSMYFGSEAEKMAPGVFVEKSCTV